MRALLFLLLAVLAGCATQPKRSSWLVIGSAQAPVPRELPKPQVPDAPTLPWKDETLSASAWRERPADADHPGIAAAAERLDARAEARRALAAKLLRLQATANADVEQFARDRDGVRRALDAALREARETVTEPASSKRMTVNLELPLAGLATAVLAQGGGWVPSPEEAGMTALDLEARRESVAQREALAMAREDVLRRLNDVPITSKLSVGQRVARDPDYRRVVEAALRTAAASRSERAPGSMWLVEVTFDAQPILEWADQNPMPTAEEKKQ